MNIRARLVVFGMIAALLLSVLVIKDGSAASLSDEQLGRISANCLSIKSSLNQLHASDALLRVNRGQQYESVGSKLMGNFNNRLGSNGFDNKGLIAVTDSYQVALTNFRSDYQSYEHQLATAIRIDCTKEPELFHNALVDARVKRAQLHTDVVRLHQYIDDYRASVSDFILNFERVTGKN